MQPTQPPEKAVMVKLRHPHTKDTVELENTAEALTPFMVRGYQQVKEEEAQ